jgi:hypothetical protein
MSTTTTRKSESMARTAPMTGAFPRLDPELRRLRLYRIELIDMHAKHQASDCYFIPVHTKHAWYRANNRGICHFFRRSKRGELCVEELLIVNQMVGVSFCLMHRAQYIKLHLSIPPSLLAVFVAGFHAPCMFLIRNALIMTSRQGL